MGRLSLRLLLLLSLAFNAVFLVYQLTRSRSQPASAAISPQSRSQMRDLREQLRPQYARLQGRLADAQSRLLAALRADPIVSRQVDACLQDISAIQAEWQRLTVSEIMRCKSFLSHRDCRCLLDRMGALMGVSDRCSQMACGPAGSPPAGK